MKAVILAAGVGSRLGSITGEKPKCMVKVGDKPILEHQVLAYVGAGVRDIIVVAGYKSGTVDEYCRQIEGADIRMIENADYETTNNMYSLYLAKEAVAGQEFLLSNGDVVFQPEIAAEMVSSQADDLVAGDRISHLDKHMKFTVDVKNYVDNISMDVPSSVAYFNSVSLFKFSSVSSPLFFEEITRIIEKENSLNEWFEVGLQRLLKRGQLKMRPFDIGDRHWAEIDDEKDLLLAQELFSGVES